MMKRFLTILCIPAALLLLSSTEGWSLPPCKGSVSTWSNCFSAYTFPDGVKYVGEWKDGLPYGQGTLIADGHKYSGGGKNGKPHGYGAYTYDDGTVKKGMWVYGEFLE